MQQHSRVSGERRGFCIVKLVLYGSKAPSKELKVPKHDIIKVPPFPWDKGVAINFIISYYRFLKVYFLHIGRYRKDIGIDILLF